MGLDCYARSMEAVDTDTLAALADSLSQQARALARRARELNQSAAALRDHVHTLQTQEVKNNGSN